MSNHVYEHYYDQMLNNQVLILVLDVHYVLQPIELKIVFLL
jgi:hypothetical protein